MNSWRRFQEGFTESDRKINMTNQERNNESKLAMITSGFIGAALAGLITTTYGLATKSQEAQDIGMYLTLVPLGGAIIYMLTYVAKKVRSR